MLVYPNILNSKIGRTMVCRAHSCITWWKHTLQKCQFISFFLKITILRFIALKWAQISSSIDSLVRMCGINDGAFAVVHCSMLWSYPCHWVSVEKEKETTFICDYATVETDNVKTVDNVIKKCYKNLTIVLLLSYVEQWLRNWTNIWKLTQCYTGKQRRTAGEEKGSIARESHRYTRGS